MSPSLVPARSFPSVVIAEFSLNFSIFINQYRQTVAILQLVPGPSSKYSWNNARMVTSLLHTEMSVPPHAGCLHCTVSPDLLLVLSTCPDSGLLRPGWVLPVNMYCWCLFFFFSTTLFELSQLMPAALFSQLFSQQNLSLHAVCP